MDFTDFNFDKPFYPEKELLKIIPIKRSTFYAWQSEWISLGNDPALMGKVKVNNSLVLWNGPVFLDWLYKYQSNASARFDYEHRDKKEAQLILSKINGNRQTDI